MTIGKSRKLFVVAILFIFTLVVSAVANAGALGGGVVIDEDSLNVRTGPGTEYSIVTSLEFGHLISLEEEHNGWYRVRYGDINGWCAANRIAQYNYVKRHGYINAPDSNMRSGPGSNGELIGVFNDGERVYAVGEAVGWYFVMRSAVEQTGWVYDGYVSF